MEKPVEDEFPYLPPDPHIMLDPVAQKVVSDIIQTPLGFNRAQLVLNIASYPETKLEAYLKRSGNDLRAICRSTGDSWTGYLRQDRANGVAFTPEDRVARRGTVECGGKEALGPHGRADSVDYRERATAYPR